MNLKHKESWENDYVYNSIYILDDGIRNVEEVYNIANYLEKSGYSVNLVDLETVSDHALYMENYYGIKVEELYSKFRELHMEDILSFNFRGYYQNHDFQARLTTSGFLSIQISKMEKKIDENTNNSLGR